MTDSFRQNKEGHGIFSSLTGVVWWVLHLAFVFFVGLSLVLFSSFLQSLETGSWVCFVGDVESFLKLLTMWVFPFLFHRAPPSLAQRIAGMEKYSCREAALTDFTHFQVQGHLSQDKTSQCHSLLLCNLRERVPVLISINYTNFVL